MRNDFDWASRYRAPLFDVVESARRRDAGIARATAKKERSALVLQARAIAIRFAAEHGTVTADDVAAAMSTMGLNYAALGPAAGAVFRDPAFEDTDQTRKCVRVSSHRRKVTVWRLKQGGAA
jgi:hypothetical protein